MNILIPHSWLAEHLKTTASVDKIVEALSLCSQSVERIHPVDKDKVYEIEITTNRPDCLAVYGIARELAAVLPRFNYHAELLPLPELEVKFPKIIKSLPFRVNIHKPSLCPRFTALIFDNIKIGPSPRVVQDRLKKVGVRALNNVVDISNYLMVELGQPMHTFDYDKILKAKMTLREAKEDEVLTTLDGQTRKLPEGAIVIEDGNGRIIDLCGIMGGLNSEVDEKTTRVLLFVQTYDPMRIRQTCQALSFRTTAAAFFEKGVDAEGVIPAMKKASAMLQKNCQARVASNLIDIYPNPPKPYTVTLSQSKLDRIIGVKIPLKEAKKILDSLQIPTKISQKRLVSQIPHWRYGDLTIEEDLVEEVSRIYGYHLLPSSLPEGVVPLDGTLKNQIFWEEKIKDFFKGLGFHETVSYSLVSVDTLKNFGFDPLNHLRLDNPISLEWTYLRPTLTPSLVSVVSTNEPRANSVKVFELAHIYDKLGKEMLPREIMTLGVVWAEDIPSKNQESLYAKLKGVTESLFEELNFQAYDISYTHKIKNHYWSTSLSADIFIDNQSIGSLGILAPKLIEQASIKLSVAALELNIEMLIRAINPEKHYQSIPIYPATVEDFSFVAPPKTSIAALLELIKSVDPLIQRVEQIATFKGIHTLRVTYQSPDKTLTSAEVVKVRRQILAAVEKNFGATLKGRG